MSEGSDKNLIDLVQRRTGKEEKTMPVTMRAPEQIAMPEPETPKFRRPKIKVRPRADLPRATFYVEPEQLSYLKYWSVLDARGISDIVREAFNLWFAKRETEEGGDR